MRSLATPCWFISAACLFFGPGCGDNLDANVTLTIESPARGTVQQAARIVVRGTATTERGRVTRVEINGIPATLGSDGGFEAVIDLDPGTNVIETVASANGTESRDRRTVSVGEMSGAEAISDGVIVRLGSRGMTKMAATVKSMIDVDAIEAGMMSAPLLVQGDGCPQDEVAVTSVAVNTRSLFLTKRLEVVSGEALFNPIELGLAAAYTDSDCVQQSGTFDFETLELHWNFKLELSMTDGPAPFVATLFDFSTLYDHELIYTNNDIELAAFERIRASLDAALAARLIELTTPEIEAGVADWLDGLGGERTEAIDDGELIVSIAPEGFTLADAALVLRFASASRTTTVDEPSYVATPTPAVFPRGFDASIAIADDVLDQALGVAWRSGMFDVALQSGATLELLTPPVVRERDGRAVVIFGDWIVRGELGEADAALSGRLDLGVEVEGPLLRLAVSEPSIAIDVLDGSLADPAGLRVEAQDVVVSRVDAILSPITLPISEYAADALAVSTHGGYIEVSIDLDSL